MTPVELFNNPETNPYLDYVSHRERSSDRKTSDFFAKLGGCKNGLKAWSTGTGNSPELAVQDALHNWNTEGK